MERYQYELKLVFPCMFEFPWNCNLSDETFDSESDTFKLLDFFFYSYYQKIWLPIFKIAIFI